MEFQERGRSGIVVVEVLPAILLLLGVMVIGFRLLWMGQVLEAGSRQALEMNACYEAVWSMWRHSSGKVAVGSRGPDGGWEILEFPDERWLPGIGPGKDGYYWRRRIDEDGAMHRCWEIEVIPPGGEGWRWWARVRL